jgi:hypothetical protein
MRHGRVAAFAALLLALACSRSDAPAPVADFIEGQVRSAGGAGEPGVWVIAETDQLATPYRKIAVTDGEGKFVLPELPSAEYRVWVRGYGLRDSASVMAKPGEVIALEVEPASGAEAAAIYPASYWLSLLQPPGGSGAWVSHFKLGCQLCHQVGSATTRARTRELYDLGLKKATYMHVTADGLGRGALLNALSDWSARIAGGELPEAPPRPQGIERNFVITQWAWGDEFTYAHDEIATDKRDPSVNAGGPIYGVDIGNDHVLALDPKTHTASRSRTPTLGGFDTPWCTQTYKPLAGDGEPLPFGFGSLGCPVEPGITGFAGKYANPANPHNPMLDAQGRVWITTQVRREWGEDLPEFCKRSPVIANNYHHRQLGWYDPKTGQYQLIDTCFGTHHLQFDERGVLWTSGDSYVIGWFDPAKYDPAKPETLEAAQGFREVKVDSDGDGAADLSIVDFNYGVIPNPVDDSVWWAQPGGAPGGPIEGRGRIVRYDPASDRFEAFVPPIPGSGPRGVDVDTKGTIWVALGGSGHLAKFERGRCAQTFGAGEQCPEGWTLYASPGPGMRVTAGDPNQKGADFHYYLFVDQFDTLGLGKDVVVINGTGSDSLLAFEPASASWTVIRVPYPLNTYTRGLDGRIDDPAAGWKGRGLWFTNGLDPLIHSEIPRSYVGRVQLRPDPLAR